MTELMHIKHYYYK